MRADFRSWFVLVVAAFALSACAKNTILREDASALSADMASVQAQTRQFYTKLAAARADFVLRLVAEDPNCEYYFPLYIVTVREPTLEIRCATQDEKKAIREDQGIEHGDVEVYTRPMEGDYAVLQLIAVVAEYQAIMAQLVANPEIDFGADLDALTKRADELRDRFGKLIGTGTGAKYDAFKDEKAALSELIRIIAEARHDQITVRRLREIASERGPAFEDALRKIVVRYRSNDAKILNNYEAFKSAARRKELNEQLNGAAPERRLELLREFELDESAVANQLTKTDPLAVGLEGLLKTHQAFRLSLLEGELTEDQRRRIAEKTLSDLKAWFNAIRQIAVLL